MAAGGFALMTASTKASESQGKKDTDEIAALKVQLTDLSAAKAAADKRVGDLEAQSKKNVAEISALRSQAVPATATAAGVSSTAAEQRISELEAQGKKASDEAARMIFEEDENG